MSNYNDKFTIETCQVCGKEIYIDNFGNGKCKYCGWEQEPSGIQYPDRVIYPNMVSFDRAKELSKASLPLIPTFDDFIAGLKYYKEMEFEYDGTLFAVCHHGDGTICLSEYFPLGIFETQTYCSYEDFREEANINGKTIKNIWGDVKNANYMICL